MDIWKSEFIAIGKCRLCGARFEVDATRLLAGSHLEIIKMKLPDGVNRPFGKWVFWNRRVGKPHGLQ